jgi:hypothetical protein
MISKKLTLDELSVSSFAEQMEVEEQLSLKGGGMPWKELVKSLAKIGGRTIPGLNVVAAIITIGGVAYAAYSYFSDDTSTDENNDGSQGGSGGPGVTMKLEIAPDGSATIYGNPSRPDSIKVTGSANISYY